MKETGLLSDASTFFDLLLAKRWTLNTKIYAVSELILRGRRISLFEAVNSGENTPDVKDTSAEIFNSSETISSKNICLLDINCRTVCLE